MRTLSYAQARRAYDRIGAFQDSQAFYEDDTTAELLRHGGFDRATAVFEFGCGTGRFAATLLADHLRDDATWRGTDLSPAMVALARERLAPYGTRATVVLSDGEPPVTEATAAFDRWVSCFVLDLLSERDVAAVLDEAWRMLRPGGLLCLASLSTGSTTVSRAVAKAWFVVHRMAPGIVGGCRPLDLRPFLPSTRWRLRHHAAHAPWGVPSEAFVAERC